MQHKPRWIYRVLLAIGLLSALVLVTAVATSQYQLVAPGLSVCFLSVALASAGYATPRKWSFTIWIATAVVVGMTYPSWFIGVGDFKFTRLFVPILQVIMFCMGTTLSVSDFLRVFRMPVGVFVGLGCQYTIMPLVGYGLARGCGLPPEIGAGIVLVGSSPSGLASNVMAFIARADVAMSVTLTAIATLLSPLVTPFLMKTLAGEMIEVDAVKLMWSITKMVIIPVVGGLIFHHTLLGRAHWLGSAMPAISMVGIIVMTVLTVAIGRDNLLQLGVILILVCFLHSTAGYVLGYLVCRTLGLTQLTCRTIALEVGLQNSGMASGIAADLHKVATLGLAPIVFGPIMNTTASTLANYWRTHPVDDEEPLDTGILVTRPQSINPESEI